MKIQRLAIAALVVAMAGLSVAEAQGRGGRGHFRGWGGLGPQMEGQEWGQRAGQRAAFLEQLDLSDTQKEELATLRIQHRADMHQLRQNGEVSREDIRAMRQQHREAFQALLSDEQKTQLEEFWASRAQHRAERSEGRRLGRGGQGRRGREGWGVGLRSALEVTDTQKEQLTALREQHWAAMQALRQDREASREDIQALWQQHREACQALLSDEQKAQLEELRAERAQLRAERPEGWRSGSGRRGRGMRMSGEGPLAAFRGVELTDEQRTKIQDLRTAFREEMQGLRESGTLDRETFQAMRQQHREAVEGILTGSQPEATALLEAATKPATAVESSTWGKIKSLIR